jgi:hypothetical protein
MTAMTTRILFNGREYTSPAEMPPDVRGAYDRAMALLADADGNGVPDLLEGPAGGHVIAIQESSITINGRSFAGPGEMPPHVRQLFESILAQATADADEDRIARPVRRPDTTALDEAGRILERFLRVLLGFVVVVVLAGAIVVMAAVEGSARAQGGRYLVAVVAILVLGAVDTQFDRLARRRHPLGWVLTDEYRRHVLRGLLLLLLAAILLLGLAWGLP